MRFDPGTFLRELRRRKVGRVAAVYAAVGFVVVQAADLSFDAVGLPPWAYTLVLFLTILGFPIAVVLAWALELTPEATAATPAPAAAGPTAGREAAGPAPRPATTAPDPSLELPAGPTITVLPFLDLSEDGGQTSFADAMAGEILTGLTRSTGLRVVSSGDAVDPSRKDVDPVAMARRLGVRYVVQGSVNRLDRHLRVTARVTDARRNVQLWSGNYDRELTSATVLFEVQDDIREQIVSTLGDFHGVIYSEEARRNVQRRTDSLSAYECLAVALAYDKYMSEDYHLKARESLERAVELDPGFDAAWAHLSWIYTDEVVFGYNPLPDSMERALAAARRAIKLAPTDYHNRWLLSRVYYFSGERDLFIAEAERSLELNASDGTTIGLIGGYLTLSGQTARGTALIEKARVLNPGHPDYYYLFLGLGALIEEDPERALIEFRKMGAVAEFPLAAVLLAATNAMVGREAQAARVWAKLVERSPGITVDEACAGVERFVPYQPEMVEKVVAALRSVQGSATDGSSPAEPVAADEFRRAGRDGP